MSNILLFIALLCVVVKDTNYNELIKYIMVFTQESRRKTTCIIRNMLIALVCVFTNRLLQR